MRLYKSCHLFVKLPRLPITNSLHSRMYRTQHIKLEQNILANDNPVKYVKRFLVTKMKRRSEANKIGLNEDGEAQGRERRGEGSGESK